MAADFRKNLPEGCEMSTLEHLKKLEECLCRRSRVPNRGVPGFFWNCDPKSVSQRVKRVRCVLTKDHGRQKHRIKDRIVKLQSNPLFVPAQEFHVERRIMGNEDGAAMAVDQLGIRGVEVQAPSAQTLQRLADAGRAATMDVGEAWWLDVDDPRAHALAEAEAPAQLAEIYGS